jgi:hypothetical protein
MEIIHRKNLERFSKTKTSSNSPLICNFNIFPWGCTKVYNMESNTCFLHDSRHGESMMSLWKILIQFELKPE